MKLTTFSMHRVAWISYMLVGASSILFLSGVLTSVDAAANQLIFRTWAMIHTAIAGIIGIRSVESMGRPQASNLVKLTGYLYTLTGLILAIESIDRDAAAIFSGAGGALLSSLVGWFFGGLIERDDSPYVSGDNISLALDPQLTAQLNEELQATAQILGTSRERLQQVESEIAEHHALLEKTNLLLEEVRKFVNEDASRREVEESHRDEVLQQLTSIKGGMQ